MPKAIGYPWSRQSSIAVETCRGLEFAHSRGIVHRDLKPGNVWITSDASPGVNFWSMSEKVGSTWCW